MRRYFPGLHVQSGPIGFDRRFQPIIGRISTVAVDIELCHNTEEETDLLDSRPKSRAGAFLDRLAADSLRFFRRDLPRRRRPVSGSSQAHQLAISADDRP